MNVAFDWVGPQVRLCRMYGATGMHCCALNTTTPNLADKHALADGPPWVTEQRCLEYQYTQLSRQTYFGQWTPPSELRIDALNTTTPNLADKHALADGPPW